jgi:hypothetical protein
MRPDQTDHGFLLGGLGNLELEPRGFNGQRRVFGLEQFQVGEFRGHGPHTGVWRVITSKTGHTRRV